MAQTARIELEAIVAKEAWTVEDHAELLKHLFAMGNAPDNFRKIAAQLERVGLDAAEQPSARDQLDVLPRRLGPEDGPEAPLAQPVGLVGAALWVGKKRERYPQVAGVGQLRLARGEGDCCHLRALRAELFVPVSQLRHVLPSG